MRHKSLPLLLLWLLLAGAGCVSTPPAPRAARPANLFPTNAFLMQRAVLKAHGREFTLNGYLALSETGGQRLLVTENFGNILADILVKPDGRVFVMRPNKLFPEKWARKYVAADLATIFGNGPSPDWPVERTGENHFLLKRRGYTLDLRIQDTRLGAQPADLFDETKVLKP